MSKVSIYESTEYNSSIIEENVSKIFNDLGGIENLIKPNQKVFLKLNALMPILPEAGITTHPEFLRGVIKVIKKITKNIYVGDNPATKELETTMKKNGTYQVCIEENVIIPNNKETTFIKNEEGKIFNNFEVSKVMVECDVLINLPKLKTHGLAYMTIAEKNLFGLIVGLNKAQWHVKAQSPLEFAQMLSDLYGAILNTFKEKKLIHIVDGILGLEGDGPGTGGKSRKANIILGSLDGIALDRVACEIVGLNHQKFITNIVANRNKLGENDLNKITILGDDIKKWKSLKFIEPEKIAKNGYLLKLIQIQAVKNSLLEHPVIDPEKCIKCGECAKICPPKALTFEKGKIPKLNKGVCIRCWCCAEVCPEAAITKSERPLLGRLIFKDRL